MSTPIISRELRQMVASVRREKTTGYITIKYQKLGQATQGLMQFVEGKLAYVSYGDDKNKDALERIKELTNPELSFGEGLSQGYLYTLDGQRNRVATAAETEAAPQETSGSDVGRSTRVTHTDDNDIAASFVDTPEVAPAMPAMGAAVGPDNSMDSIGTMPSTTTPTGMLGTMRSGASDVQAAGQQPRSINFEDHTGTAGNVFADGVSSSEQAAATFATNASSSIQQASASTFNQVQQGLGNIAGQARQAAATGIQNVVQGGQQLADNTAASVAGVAQAASSSMPRIPSVANQSNAAHTSRLTDSDKVPWNKRLETTLMSTLIGLTLLTLLSFGLFDWWQFRRNAIAELELKATDITEQLASHLSLPLFDVDGDSVDNSIRVEMSDEDFIATQVVYAGNNDVFAGWRKDTEGNLIDISTMPEISNSFIVREQDITAPIGSSTSEALGTVHTFFSTESIAIKTRRFLLNESFRLFLLAVVLILATYLFLRFALIGRILHLTKLANAISTGQSDTVIDVESSDELGLLAEAIKRMQASLQFAMRRLRR